LGGRVASDDVATDNIVAGSVKKEDPISVPSDIVVLDQVLSAATLEADSEIDVPVWVVEAAISVECRLAHPVLVAIDETNPAASGSV